MLRDSIVPYAVVNGKFPSMIDGICTGTGTSIPDVFSGNPS